MAGASGPWWAPPSDQPQPPWAPSPSPDQTPAPTGAGPTPQPPTVPPPQAGPAPTLGEVATEGDGGGGGDVTSRFNQYLQLMKQANADAYRPHLSEESKPGLLANILTFGMAGLMDRDYRMAYNAAIDRGNAEQHAQDTKDALSMVGQDVHLANGNISQQMRMLQLQLQMQNAEYLRHHRQTMEDLDRQRVGQGERRLGQGEENLRLRGAVRAPKTPEEVASLADQGLEWRQDSDLPSGFGHLYAKGKGGGGQPPTPPAPPAPAAAEPSPAGAPGAGQQPPPSQGAPPGLPTTGKTSGGIPYRVVTPSGGTPPAAHDPSDPNEPGITPSEKLRRQKLREQTAAKPVPVEVQKQVTTIDESVAKMNDIEKLLDDPEVQKWIGPGMGRVSRGLYATGIGAPGKVNQLLAGLAYLRAQAVGPLLHGSRNEKIWAQIQEHLPNASDSPELLRDKLRVARQTYIRNRQLELEASGLTRGQAGAGGQ